MAGGADGGSVMRLMTADAAGHGRDAGVLRHGFDLPDVAVAHGALHTRLQMRAVRPGNSGRHLVDAHPRNGLIRFCKFGQLHDRRTIFGNRRVTHHAGARRGEGHLISGVGIRVAGLAAHTSRHVQLMAERNRLLGCGMRRDVVGDFLFRRRPLLTRLLRARCEAQEEKNDCHCHKQSGERFLVLHELTFRRLAIPGGHSTHLSCPPY